MQFIIFRGVGLSFSGCGMAFVQIKAMPRMARFLDLYCKFNRCAVYVLGQQAYEQAMHIAERDAQGRYR